MKNETGTTQEYCSNTRAGYSL